MPAGTRRARKARSGDAKSFHSADGSLGTDEMAGHSDGLSVIGSANILILPLPSNTKTPFRRKGRNKRNASSGLRPSAGSVVFRSAPPNPGGEQLEGLP